MTAAHFSQCAILLCDNAFDTAALSAVATEHGGTLVSSGFDGWMRGTATWKLPPGSGAAGTVLMDLFERTWPDHMGDPETDAALFAAWTIGWLGPHTYPGGLERATLASGSTTTAKAVQTHSRFIRLLFAPAASPAPSRTLDGDAIRAPSDLTLLTSLAERLVMLDGIHLYYNPSGEVVLQGPDFATRLHHFRSADLLPLPLWANTRLIHLDDDWSAMDIVGMDQLDALDHEAVFNRAAYDAKAVSNFLYNMAAYTFRHGNVIGPGETTDGPRGCRWIADHAEESVLVRTRAVVRWFPLDGTVAPDNFRTHV